MRKRISSAVVALSIAAAGTLGAGSASASPAQGYISGAGVVTNDWGDEGLISANHSSNSGAAYLWQWVLYSEGAIEQNGTQFDKSDIDGVFGPNTVFATKKLQSRWGLTPDGVVGSGTLSRADNKLSWAGPGYYVAYNGARVVITFNRGGSTGMYYSHNTSGSGWVGARY
jgi:hypothetical protein